MCSRLCEKPSVWRTSICYNFMFFVLIFCCFACTRSERNVSELQNHFIRWNARTRRRRLRCHALRVHVCPVDVKIFIENNQITSYTSMSNAQLVWLVCVCVSAFEIVSPVAEYVTVCRYGHPCSSFGEQFVCVGIVVTLDAEQIALSLCADSFISAHC